jgi:hypothetical protein
MAYLDSAVKLPLWIGVGLRGAVALGLSIQLLLRTTSWRTRIVVKDLTTQVVTTLAFGVEIISAMALLAQALGQQIYSRSDTVDVNILPFIVNIITYALITRTLTIYLCHNSGWEHYLWLGSAFFAGCLLFNVMVGEVSRYIQFAFAWFALWWVIHVLWVYRRRRSDGTTVFLLLWVTVVWNVCLILPALLGHANLQVIGYLGETWWTVLGGLLAQTLPNIIMVTTLYKLGAVSPLVASGGRMFNTRCSDDGCPGDCSIEYQSLQWSKERVAVEMTSSSSNDDMPLVRAAIAAARRAENA